MNAFPPVTTRPGARALRRGHAAAGSLLLGLLVLGAGAGDVRSAAVDFNRVNIDNGFINPTDVHAADLDGDGDTDVLATSGEANGTVAWWSNPGDATIVNPIAWSRTTLSGGLQLPSSVVTGDLDGDGDPDVIVTAALGDVAFWLNPGGAAAGNPAQWQRVTVDGSLTGATDAFVADVDGDGLPDLMACESLTGKIAWYRNPGGATIVNPAAWTKTIIGNGLTSVNGAAGIRAHDFDGDGDPDIVSAGTNTARMFRNPGGARTINPAQWLVTSFSGSFVGSSSVKLGDVNLDGNMDLIVALTGQNYVLWLENPDGPDDTRGSSATQWTRRQLDSLTVTFAGGVTDVSPGDLDADGDLDIAVAPAALTRMDWLDSPGGGTIVNPIAWTQRTIDSSLASPAAVHVADLDGDGAPDVVGGGAGNNVVTIYLNQSAVAPAFQITDIQVVGEDDTTVTYSLTWTSIAGLQYPIQASDNLTDWSTVATAPSLGLETTAEITVSKDEPRTYWRIGAGASL